MFDEQFIQEQKLTPEQVEAVTGQVNNIVAEKVKTAEDEYKAKSIQDAEGILHGATKKVVELTGIEHEKGQKIADYLTFASSKYLEGSKAALERKQQELDEKIKSGTGSEALKAKLAETEQQLDKLKQREAVFSEWEKEDYKGKYESLSQKTAKQNQDLAFQSVKPSFPDTINSYEAKGRWGEFVNGTLEKYNIERDNEGVAYAIDKNNEHIRHKLEDLVKQDEALTTLLKGRQVTGLGSDPQGKVKVEGVPFEIPENATREQAQKLVKDHLITVEKLQITSAAYSKRFAELNKLILEKTPRN